jgi:hypothetical protein
MGWRQPSFVDVPYNFQLLSTALSAASVGDVYVRAPFFPDLTLSTPPTLLTVTNQQGSFIDPVFVMGLLMNFAIAVGLSALSQASPTLAKRAQPLVFLDYATYQGFAGTNGITHFYGMRYAAPPTGDFRWRAPQDPPTATGIQQATAVS